MIPTQVIGLMSHSRSVLRMESHLPMIFVGVLFNWTLHETRMGATLLMLASQIQNRFSGPLAGPLAGPGTAATGTARPARGPPVRQSSRLEVSDSLALPAAFGAAD